jgi:PIN domain nuclease of toxin-antitoxin system
LLLDTQALLWWFEGGERLSRTARQAIAASDSEVFVPVVAAWELAIKTAIGKLDAQALLDGAEQRFRSNGFEVVSVTLDHALRVASLPTHHKDPFDRMLVAQAQAESLTIVSSDPIFEHYGVRRLW